MNRKIRCEWLYSETVNYGMQQNHVPVVKGIVITNITQEELRGITVKLTSEPQFTYEWLVKCDVLPVGQSIDLGTIHVQMSPTFLGELSERISGSLTVSILQDETEIYQERGPIAVLAFDEWSGLAILPELTAAFVTPNHPSIAQIVREAADIMGKWSGNTSFTSYQSKDPNQIRVQAAAIYAALQHRRIAYCVAPPSFETIGQRVRLPEMIVTHRMGNCLDLSFLYAACLEAIGLHPLLIFTKGHAFSGVWLEEETFAESVQDDISVVTKRIANGINQICVVEATAFVEGKSISFDRAVALGEANLQDASQFDCLIDIRRARSGAIRPLPLRTATTSGWQIASVDEQKMEAVSVPARLDVLGKPDEVDSLPQATRQKLWERSLLDLTLRNSLLNFRLSKSSLPIISTQLGELEDALADGEEFQLLAKPNDWEENGRNVNLYQSIHANHPLAQLIREEFNRKRLRADLSAADLDNRIVHIYRSAKSSLEENGANTLYLALGLLKWYESPVSEKPRYAPIVLIPVDIIRKSSRQGYLIRARDEEPQMNITLLEMLKQDFGIGIDGLDPLPTDDKGIALKQVFNVFRHALIHVGRWDVEETAYLGLFSFGQFVMWHDIRTRASKLAENPIVASLMEGKLKWQEPLEDKVTPLDKYHPASLAIPISADSSQLLAIRAAANGQSFVLHGPPGTGKSQTITNMIAHALASGKRVLFVAEKMAALSVVQRRLGQIGLGSFCLELHSNKSTKKSVLDQLAAAIETKQVPTSNAWNSQAERLFQLRGELNSYVEALHRRQTCGMTLFEVITGYERTGNGQNIVRFDDGVLGELNSEKILAWKDYIEQLRVAGEGCGEPYLHPLRDTELTSYTQSVKSDIERLLQDYMPKLSKQGLAMKQIAQWFKLDTSRMSYANNLILVQLSELAYHVPDVKPALFQAVDVEAVLVKLRTTVDQGRRRDEARNKVYSRFITTEIAQLDAPTTLSEWNRMELQWFLPKWSGQQRIYKMLKKLVVVDQELTKDQVKSSLIDVITWQDEEQKLKACKEQIVPWLGHTLDWNEDGKWEDLEAACDWVENLQAHLRTWFGQSYLATQARIELAEIVVDVRSDERQQAFFKDVWQNHKHLTQLESELSNLLQVSFEQIKSLKDVIDWFAFMYAKANLWLTHLDKLRDWSTWRRIRSQAAETGLLPVILPYEQGRITNANLIDTYERGLFYSIANYIISHDDVLQVFSGNMFEETINRFKAADNYFAKLTQEEIVARLSSKVPQMTQEASQSSEAGILQRAIRSGGRNMSIRKLFEQIPYLLPRLTPCMLMSPISVAQYLDPNSAKFDLVIFDEASQVPTAQAVGALARGHQAVIVGDPKQLPPTSFFSKNSSEVEDEDQALQDMESILDDCLALGMPERHLTWHYRSRHESLIAFSNSHYYENKLMTFPSPDEPISSVIWHPVEGFYDRGRSKQNRAEADAVIEEIIRRVKDPILQKMSIGVVTFSSIQQTLIEDMLENAMKQVPELENTLAQLPEPLFIKNLENVQGDERDIILFSVGYGPDATGKVSLNLGPLNRQGGWRRLNVAVSRARYEMHVFATLRSDQLHASRIGAQGVLGLKAFLAYAEKGKQALPANTGAPEYLSFSSSLHLSIASELKVLGYNTNIHVGVSGFRVDIGILDSEHQGQYAVGILLDGPTYQHAASARDRDILREQVLVQLGWTLLHVWSPDWWENKTAIVHRIVGVIQRSKDMTNNGRIEEIRQSNQTTLAQDYVVSSPDRDYVQVIQPEKTDELQVYQICALKAVSLGAESFTSPQHTSLILEQLNQVIQEEGPISRSLLAKRILQSWGITRMGARLDQRFTELLVKMNPRTTETDGNIFYWPKEVEPQNWRVYRVSSDESQRRVAEDLPAEEIVVAVKSILASQISLPVEELVKQVVKTLGYARSGSALDKVVRSGIQKAVEQEAALMDEQQRIIVR